MSVLRGPMTRVEIRAARGVKDAGAAAGAEAMGVRVKDSVQPSTTDPWAAKHAGRVIAQAN